MNQNDPRMWLITAALDGEISPTDRKRLRRLLRSDPELLLNYQKLRKDKRSFVSLAVPVLPVDFSRTVADALKRSNPKEIAQKAPFFTMRPKVGVNRIQWYGVLAFSISWLIGLAILSSLLFRSGNPKDLPPPVFVVNDSKQEPGIRINQNSNENQQVVSELPKESDGIPEEKWADWLLPHSATDGNIAENFYPRAEDPGVEAQSIGQGSAGRNRFTEILGAPALPSWELEELTLKLPRMIPWNDLGALPGAFNSMKDKSGTIQVDFPSHEPGHAVDVLIEVLKAQKKGVVVDGLAMDRLRRGNIRSNYIVVLEDIDPRQLEALLTALKNSDGKRSISKSAQLASSLIVSAPDAVRKQLKSMTGWDFGIDVPAKNPKAGVPKDLEEETTKQAIKAIESGANSRIVGNTRAMLPSALVVAFSPYYQAAKTQPQSLEVRRFVEIRQAATKSGLGRAILVFRN